MDAYRLFILVAICGACVILQFSLAKSEENTQDRETDPDFQGLNIREKRSFRRYRYRCGYTCRLRRFICSLVKGVDCQNNTRCARRQVLCFGKPKPKPTSTATTLMSTTPMMSMSPSSIVTGTATSTGITGTATSTGITGTSTSTSSSSAVMM